MYLGIGELRRADPDGDLADQELDAYLELAVEAMIPPDRIAAFVAVGRTRR